LQTERFDGIGTLEVVLGLRAPDGRIDKRSEHFTKRTGI
jgi:hypothetical protein